MLQRVVLQRVVQSGPQTAEHRRSAAAEASFCGLGGPGPCSSPTPAQPLGAEAAMMLGPGG